MGLLSALFGPKAGSKLPAYKRDHQDPHRRLVHGFLAFYTGDDGDPKHTLDREDNDHHLRQGWSLQGPQELVELMNRYENPGECTVAFDLIRTIKLARHGAGAGWISDDDSWQRCLRCAQRLRQTYARWEDVYVDFQAGRAQWYRDALGQEAPSGEYERYAQRYALGNVLLFSKLPLN